MTKNEADSNFHRWGIWSKHHLGLNYPSENPIARLMREGPGAGQSSKQAEIAMPKGVEATERVVATFPPVIRKAVKLKYIAQLPDNVSARMCKCDADEFIRRINHAIDLLSQEPEPPCK